MSIEDVPECELTMKKTLEERVQVLEKRVAELEGRVQEQPMSNTVMVKLDAEEFSKRISEVIARGFASNDDIFRASQG